LHVDDLDAAGGDRRRIDRAVEVDVERGRLAESTLTRAERLGVRGHRFRVAGIRKAGEVDARRGAAQVGGVGQGEEIIAADRCRIVARMNRGGRGALGARDGEKEKK
jgi:hypothetical protein